MQTWKMCSGDREIRLIVAQMQKVFSGGGCIKNKWNTDIFVKTDGLLYWVAESDPSMVLPFGFIDAGTNRVEEYVTITTWEIVNNVYVVIVTMIWMITLFKL